MTKLLDPTMEPPGSGNARIGGAFYHVSFRSGSRGKGSCAASAHDYITREGEYDGPERDPAIYTESGNLPDWAEGNARAFWDAADLYERANGRLYLSADYALPSTFKEAEWIELARDFARGLTADEQLPYTLAIHRGRSADGQVHNPHAHLMVSERRNDGIERSRDNWFRRADPHDPGRGGAPKSRTFHGRRWVEAARKQWAQRLNEAFEQRGSAERVDHRSYERRGIDRAPSEHIGPSAAYQSVRGAPYDRLDDLAATKDDLDRLKALDRSIADLETESSGSTVQIEQIEEDRGSRRGRREETNRDDDWSRGR